MSARFYYYPEPDGSHLITIDLGEELGELFSDFFVNAVDGISITGHRQRTVGRMGEIVNIQRDRLKLSEDLAYQFHALQNHLDRGYSCSFTADHTKSWAAPIKAGTLLTGATTIQCFSNPFNNMTDPSLSGLKPAVDDYITIETAPPAMLSEQHKLSNVTNLSNVNGGSFVNAKPLNFEYDRPAFARWYRYWPVLKRPQREIGRNIITNENGRLFSLNITLEPDYGTLFSFHPDYYDGITNSGTTLGVEHVGRVPDGMTGRGLDSAGIPFSPERQSNAFGLRKRSDKLR